MYSTASTLEASELVVSEAKHACFLYELKLYLFRSASSVEI